MTNNSKTWTVVPTEDPKSGELIITFPEDFLKQAGWKADDTLVWNMQDDGVVHITKK